MQLSTAQLLQHERIEMIHKVTEADKMYVSPGNQQSASKSLVPRFEVVKLSENLTSGYLGRSRISIRISSKWQKSNSHAISGHNSGKSLGFSSSLFWYYISHIYCIQPCLSISHIRYTKKIHLISTFLHYLM